MTNELPQPEDLQVEEILALTPNEDTAARVFDALFARWTPQGLSALRRQRVADQLDGLLESGYFTDEQVGALEARADEVKAAIASSPELARAEEDAAGIISDTISDVTFRIASGIVDV